MAVLSESENISGRDALEALNKLSTSQQTPAQYASLREARAEFERDFILKTLIAHDWKMLETAEALGIERTHLWKKMKRYGIGEGR